MRIYTRTGDQGQTGLVGGARVPKDDDLIEALGALDELNAQVGVVLTMGLPDAVISRLLEVQAALFEIGAAVAGAKSEAEAVSGRLVQRLENDMDELEVILPPLRAFILPGGTVESAQLHLARTVCRRAERRMVKLSLPIKLLNRLSDWMFCQARAANARASLPDREWNS